MLKISPNVMPIMLGWSRHGVPSWLIISQSSRIPFSMWAFALRPRRSDKEPASGLKSVDENETVNCQLKSYRSLVFTLRGGEHKIHVAGFDLDFLKLFAYLPYSSLENLGFSMFRPDVNGFLLCLSLCLLAYWLNIATLAPRDSFKSDTKGN